ncbi:hypothetical protein ABZ915_01365 [Streptomyces sp. NPDC046915]
MALIDELSDGSPEFARAWEKYDVVGDTRGRRRFHHPRVGASPSASRA